VKCLLGVGDELAFLEVLHDVGCMTMDCRCDPAYHVKNQPYIGLSMAMELWADICRSLVVRPVRDVVAGPDTHNSGVTNSVTKLREL
jgi:hypothetical protein